MSSPAAAAKHPQRVLMRFTPNTLRLPDELAAEIGADEVFVVGPTGVRARPWRVGVERDGDGAFLGRGWREFAAACGAQPGWLMVLRHRGRGILSIKAFDEDCCLRELELVAQPPAGTAEATTISRDTAHKPQFLRVFPKDFMEKMLIPAKFVQQYIPKEHLLDNRMAIVFGPLGKVSHVELQMSQSEVFFGGGWSQFLVLHDIAEANALLLRYEGNMVFTVKVFQPDGCQRESKCKDTKMQQISTLPDIQERHKEPSVSIQKRCNSYWPRSDGQNKQKGPGTCLKKAPWKISVFVIGPPSWIKKEINANSLKRELALAGAFCGAIGLQEHCTITLKTSMSSTESWQVLALPSKKGSYQLGKGWRTFCKENSLKLGDICTFNVVETTLWHVVVTRCKERINQLFYEHPSASSRMRRSKNKWSKSKRNKRPKGSRSYLEKASFQRKSFYEIGPPSWIKKVINAHTLGKYLALATDFCDAIGLRESCMITLKISMDSTISWQVSGISIKNGRSYLLIKGWRKFCQENSLNEGDICTFNIVETTLWHVVITRYKEKIDHLCYENHSSSSMKRKRENDRSRWEVQKRPKVSMTWWFKASSKTGCTFEIGPPAWVKKEISTWAVKNNTLYLPPVFCKAIGIQGPCTITLKTSMSSTTSWQVRVTPYDNSSHHVTGMKRFCQDNGIKVGDVCTFEIIETALWHVVIEPR